MTGRPRATHLLSTTLGVIALSMMMACAEAPPLPKPQATTPAAEQADADRPNILLIVIDGARSKGAE